MKRPLILFYNPCFGSYPDTRKFDCRIPCTFTADRALLPEADAVVFHLPEGKPFLDARKYPRQLWVAWSMESRTNTPIFSDRSLMDAFDLEMSVSRSADVWCPYLPLDAEWQRALARPLPERREETASCVLLQSAANNKSGRNEFASELMRHIEVHSFGKFLNNRQLEGTDSGPETKLELIRNYRFCLGLENTIEPDYVTEKFFQPLLAGSVPVYRGAPNVADYAPGDHSYIDASAFQSPKHLADYLRHLVHTPAEYDTYFAWRTQPPKPAFMAMLNESSMEPFCRLAELVARRLPISAPESSRPRRAFGWRGFAISKMTTARSAMSKAIRGR